MLVSCKRQKEEINIKAFELITKVIALVLKLRNYCKLRTFKAAWKSKKKTNYIFLF